MTYYLQWSKLGPRAWRGFAKGRLKPLFEIHPTKHTKRHQVRLERFRHDGTMSAVEICENVRHAREYAGELARLAGYEAY
jgi:hypothetical protein